MNKFSNVQSNEKYINYTIHNYINCYEKLSNESIERFTDLFKNLKNHRISIGNVLVEKKPMQGVKLAEKEKFPLRNDILLSQSLSMLSESINSDDKKEILFYKSLVHFCDSINYLNSTELKEVNDLFEEVNHYNCDLNNPIGSEQLLFYSYDRYPNK